MSTSGLCQICMNAEADHRCDRCGSMVCADHFRVEAGVCLDCAAELGLAGDGDATADHPDVDRYQY